MNDKKIIGFIIGAGFGYYAMNKLLSYTPLNQNKPKLEDHQKAIRINKQMNEYTLNQTSDSINQSSLNESNIIKDYKSPYAAFTGSDSNSNKKL